MTRVKICGIQELDHALVAAQAGADFIGLVFVPERRRRIGVDRAKAIVSRLKSHSAKVPKVVGLFADQPLDEVNRVVRAGQLDMVQLCGQESLEYCGQIEAEVIKVLHVSNPPNPPLQKGGEEGTPPLGNEGQGQVSPSRSGGQGGTPSFDKGGSRGIPTPTGTSTSDVPHIDLLAERIQTYCQAGYLVTLDRLVDGLQGGTGQSFDWAIADQLSQQGHSFLLAGGLTPDNVAQAVSTVRPWGVDVSSGVETGGVKDPVKIKEFIRNAKQFKSEE